jgi:polyferredoxin
MPTPILMKTSQRLTAIKLVHTVAWAAFAACIVAIPIASLMGKHLVAAWLAGIVFAEVLVLAFNQWSCPLTSIAARYTEDRRPNFDIYLPLWLAKYNKQIFGPLYVAGMLFAFVHWLQSSALQ